MHRTQILLEERHYELLRREAERQRVSLGELVRRAVDAVYAGSDAAFEASLDHAFGAWGTADSRGDAVEYVDALRGGGRLGDLDR